VIPLSFGNACALWPGNFPYLGCGELGGAQNLSSRAYFVGGSIIVLTCRIASERE
jgi:hypothetical protein